MVCERQKLCAVKNIIEQQATPILGPIKLLQMSQDLITSCYSFTWICSGKILDYYKPHGEPKGKDESLPSLEAGDEVPLLHTFIMLWL
jgi:hypothetical protein